MTTLHDAAMAAKRFHDAALAALDRPDDSARKEAMLGTGAELALVMSQLAKDWLGNMAEQLRIIDERGK